MKITYTSGLDYSMVYAYSIWRFMTNTNPQGLWEGGSADTSVWGPESQKGAYESLMGTIALGIDVLF